MYHLCELNSAILSIFYLIFITYLLDFCFFLLQKKSQGSVQSL